MQTKIGPLPEIDLDSLPDWVCWIAQDRSGAWWGYQVEPNQAHDGWYENEVGRIKKIADGPTNIDWLQTLQRVR